MSAAFEVRVGGLSVCEEVMVMLIHVGFGIVVVKPFIVAIVLDEKHVLM
jgi:hypothetical protein